MSGEAIAGIQARQILDSRGRPTLEASVLLAGGASGRASVPSGASTGRHEAVERRDGDPARYGGRSVQGAVAAVVQEIAPALRGAQAGDQAAIDRSLIELDGSVDKSRLGANAILAVSLACARATANARGVPLWRALGGEEIALLPMPMVNMISGGAHASGGLDFQDLLAIPLGASSVAEALEMCVAVRDALGGQLLARGLSTLKGDEGGFAPSLPSHEAACSLLVESIAAAGFAPGADVALAWDVAANELYDPDRNAYTLRAEGRVLDAAALVELLDELVQRYPIVSIEDPLAEDDWDGWRLATERLGGRIQLIGDDLFVTNPQRLARGIEQATANAVLVKMNQIGTLSETLAVVAQAKAAGYATIVSARSGETEDSALADLAVAAEAGQIKVGSVAQSERLAKYNRLLRLEDELGPDRSRFAGASALAGWSAGR